MGKEKGDALSQYNRPVTDEAIFKASKEIVVKFIETGRLTPVNFDVTFNRVYSTVKQAVRCDNDGHTA